MKHRIETSSFEFAHGKKPRGTGCWAFDFHKADRSVETRFAPGMVSFADARKWAEANVPAGTVRIQVGS